MYIRQRKILITVIMCSQTSTMRNNGLNFSPTRNNDEPSLPTICWKIAQSCFLEVIMYIVSKIRTMDTFTLQTLVRRWNSDKLSPSSFTISYSIRDDPPSRVTQTPRRLATSLRDDVRTRAFFAKFSSPVHMRAWLVYLSAAGAFPRVNQRRLPSGTEAKYR